MDVHRLRKIEVVIEEVHAGTVIEVFERHGAKGYTVVHGVTGKGSRGLRAGGPFSEIFSNVLIFTVVPEALCSGILREVHELLESRSGIVLVSDVHILRPEHF